MPAPDRSEVVVSGGAAGLGSKIVRAAVEHVLRRERRDARISISFVGKARMTRLNAEHFNRNQPTDVISFALPLPDGTLAGEICICRYAVAINARLHEAAVRDELLRVVIHGTMHVLGWDHPDGNGRTRSPMWRKQEQHLASVR